MHLAFKPWQQSSLQPYNERTARQCGKYWPQFRLATLALRSDTCYPCTRVETHWPARAQATHLQTSGLARYARDVRRPHQMSVSEAWAMEHALALRLSSLPLHGLKI